MLADSGGLADAPAEVRVAVTPEMAGWRLDRALAVLVPTLSRERLKALMSSGAVAGATGLLRDPAKKAVAGDRLTVTIPVPAPSHSVAQDIALNVVFEDAHLLIVDKPAGLVVHPAAGNLDGTLVNALLHHCAGRLSGIGGVALPFQITQGGPSVVLIDTPDLKVTAFPVNHAPVEPAVGYKFVYKGRTVVISGDTAPSKRVEQEAKGADLLVHEALSPELVRIQETAALKAGRNNLAHVFADIPDYHTTPTGAAVIAQAAGVKMLLLDHIVPGLPFKALEIPFVGDARSKFSGPLQVGHDGDRVSLPANSDKIETGSALRF